MNQTSDFVLSCFKALTDSLTYTQKLNSHKNSILLAQSLTASEDS